MSQLFSTELVPASDRIDAWQWNAQQVCGSCRIQLPRASFHGSIGIRQLGELRLTRFSSSPLSFWKWPTNPGSSEESSCIVITQIAGARRYLQSGLEVWLNAGDSTIIDAARPWSSTCSTDCVRLYLRMPRWMMESRLQARNIPIAKKISGASRIGKALSRLSQSLYDEAGQLQQEESAAALHTYFHALAACIGRGESAPEQSRELLSRILCYVNAHLAEPTLSPLEVASALGISRRHLHRVFAETGGTIGDYVRAQRLKHCHQEMADPRFRNHSVTEIAFRWGFSDAAHFSHVFRKQFGVSARVFRATRVNGTEHPFRNLMLEPTSQVRYTN